VFTLAELNAIAEIVRQYPNLIVISDEVYKYTVHSPFEAGDKYSLGHYHFARLPGTSNGVHFLMHVQYFIPLVSLFVLFIRYVGKDDNYI
jgi:hypothetical protein